MILNRSAAILPLRWPGSLSSTTTRFLSSFTFQSPSLLPNSHPTSLRSPLSSYLRHQRLLLLKARAFGAAADHKSFGGGDTFFASDAVSWTSLGVSDRLSRSLSDAGLQRPSLVQAASLPSILSGSDVIVAAETGSGKTYGYLVPLINNVCSRHNPSANTDKDEGLTPEPWLSLVLCPNVTLCEQVVRMANSLCGENGKPLLRTAAVCGRHGWPVSRPDIIVSSPAALLNYLNAFDPERRRRSDFMRSIKSVVFDEADMLIGGSFQNQVISLIHMLRFDEKLLSQIEKSSPKDSMDIDPESSTHFNFADGEDLSTKMFSEGEEDAAIDAITGNVEVGNVKRKGWRRGRKTCKRSKQYIFIAATLPVNGKCTAGGVLKRMFPDAKWISGSFLHHHNPRLKQKWIEVAVDKQVDVLIEALSHGSSQISDSIDGVRRTMVFANTVGAVESIAKILRGAGIECRCYHRDTSLEESAEVLTDFRQNGGVLVCTDAAARGVDIPNVSHVIQAEFAKSAVDFLHRTGRTARAGQSGLVTSLYYESDRDLVAAVRQAEGLGRPVEDAFSRKRSFRNKLKKRGSNEAKDTSIVVSSVDA